MGNKTWGSINTFSVHNIVDKEKNDSTSDAIKGHHKFAYYLVTNYVLL
jgi:hypothetical protein